MSDKPTFKEYRGMRFGVVKTEDGRYFAADSKNVLLRMLMAVYFVLVVGLYITVHSLAYKTIPANTLFDFAIFWSLLSWAPEWLRYRLSRFRELTEETDEFREAVSLFNSRFVKTGRILITVLAISVMAFALANSFTVQYIRCVIEDRPEMEISYGSGDMTNAPDGDDAYQVTIPQGASPSFMVMVSKTLDTHALSLDGRPVTQRILRRTIPNWFWEEGYLKSRYYVFPDAEDIRDGSVLELTCGGLRRTIIFHIDESAGA